MDESFEQYQRWWNAGEPFALATIIEVRGSAPLPVGTAMGVGPEHSEAWQSKPNVGIAVGSISGGCVEGAVFESAQSLLLEDDTPRIEFFGYSDETAFANGLSCGGELEVFVEKINQANFPQFPMLCTALRQGQAAALVTVVAGNGDYVGKHLLVLDGGAVEGNLEHQSLSDAAVAAAKQMMSTGQSGLVAIDRCGKLLDTEVRLFVKTFSPPPRMLIFGAIDFASALADAAKLLGYRVTVCDARSTFATRQRFPGADEVVVDWPHRYLQKEYDAGTLDPRTVICVLTHDTKFDVPLLLVAMKLPVRYVGAMGSRRTHRERADLLLDAGLEPESLARLHSPIGLGIGARDAAETAVSILAEIIAVKNRRSGLSLSVTDEPIHPPPDTGNPESYTEVNPSKAEGKLPENFSDHLRVGSRHAGTQIQ